MSEEQTTAPSAAAAGGGAASGDAEESTATFEPVVHLEEVETETGEEDENVEFKMRAKLYRYCESLLDVGTGNKQWNDRGIGDVRFMKHKETGKTRVLMRQEKTLKIVLNHLVSSEIEVTAQAGSDRAWTWSANNFANGEVEASTFALKFKNPENAGKFKEQWEKSKEEMARLASGGDAADTAAGDEAAKALGGASIFKAAEGGAAAAEEDDDDDDDEEAQ